MKIKSTIILALAMGLFVGMAEENDKPNLTFSPGLSSYNSKFIGVLKDKSGVLLGKVYIADFQKDIFKRLIIVKENKGEIDTLYSIINTVFKNRKGVDIRFNEKTFNGYKIESIKGDSIQLFGIGHGSSGPSDPVIIVWDSKKKMFAVFQEP